MKKFLFLIVFAGVGFTANAASNTYCMTTNQHFCQDCDPQMACRLTMDVERITYSGRNYNHETIACGICEEDADVILRGPSCK